MRYFGESQIEGRDFHLGSLVTNPTAIVSANSTEEPELPPHPPFKSDCAPSLLRLCQRSPLETRAFTSCKGNGVTPTMVSRRLCGELGMDSYRQKWGHPPPTRAHQWKPSWETSLLCHLTVTGQHRFFLCHSSTREKRERKPGAFKEIQSLII